MEFSAEDVALNDGKTIGFSADDTHEIKLNKGVSLPEQDTLKIFYEEKALMEGTIWGVSIKGSIPLSEEKIDCGTPLY